MHSKKIFVLLLSFLLCFASSFALSKTIQFYGGAEVGYGSQDFDNGSAGASSFSGVTVSSVTVRKNDDNDAWRVYAGLDFNRYIGIDASYMRFGMLNWNIATSFVGLPTVTVNMAVKTYLVNLLLKLKTPEFKHMYLYVLGGPAYVNSKARLSSGVSDFADGVRPEIGVGGAVNVSKHAAITVTYVHVFGEGDLHMVGPLPCLNAVTFGIMLHEST